MASATTGLITMGLTTTHARVAAIIGLMLWMMCGCVWKGGQDHIRPSRLDDAQEWRSTPSRIRVYPSTRFTQDSDQPILDARIELVDDMGDPVKAAGRLRLELFARSATGKPDIGQRLYSWDVSTWTLADQKRHYDPITRAYLFRLKLDEPQTSKIQTVLKVMFTSGEAPRLEAQASLPMNLHAIKSFGHGR